MKRIRLVISGNVQGVGFRAWNIRQAKELGLTGWVSNREDGAVEVVAEGARASLEGLIKRCQRGPNLSAGEAKVKKVDVEWQEATGEFVGFEVIY